MIVIGNLMVGAINILIAFFNNGDINVGVLCSVLSLIITCSMITEPVYQLYLCEISNNSSLGLANFISFTINSLITLGIPFIVRGLGPSPLYYIFGGLMLTASVFQMFFLKETAHLTDKEKKDLYTPKKFLFSKENTFNSEKSSDDPYKY